VKCEKSDGFNQADLMHAPTIPGTCARGRGRAGRERLADRECGARAGADAAASGTGARAGSGAAPGGIAGGRWREGAHFGMGDLRLECLKPDRLI